MNRVGCLTWTFLALASAFLSAFLLRFSSLNIACFFSAYNEDLGWARFILGILLDLCFPIQLGLGLGSGSGLGSGLGLGLGLGLTSASQSGGWLSSFIPSAVRSEATLVSRLSRDEAASSWIGWATPSKTIQVQKLKAISHVVLVSPVDLAFGRSG